MHVVNVRRVALVLLCGLLGRIRRRLCGLLPVCFGDHPGRHLLPCWRLLFLDIGGGILLGNLG